MVIQQFEDKALAHFSYAIASGTRVVVIDPSRDILPYLEFALEQNARIYAVIETHPHADFVSGHLELHNATGAAIYCSRLTQAEYEHTPFDKGNKIIFGDAVLKALNTPGHSPDSISVVLEEKGKDIAVFTGDTLFIGDCGRPDLRENTGNVSAKREALAADMYHSLREQLMRLGDGVIVYPAHGAGSLCGKSLSDAASSTIGREKLTNWSLQEMSETEFVTALLAEQPFIPKYFPYNVAVNKQGAPRLENAISNIPATCNGSGVIVDTRPEKIFKQGHQPGAINIQDGTKFETWLGSIIAPEEPFCIITENEAALQELVRRTAKIGYESFLKGAAVFEKGSTVIPALDLAAFRSGPGKFTIVDVRNIPEKEAKPIFPNAINIPLHELRERAQEIPRDKPIVVHCAGGYRSAAGSSILAGALDSKVEVYDLGEAVKEF